MFHYEKWPGGCKNIIAPRDLERTYSSINRSKQCIHCTRWQNSEPNQQAPTLLAVSVAEAGRPRPQGTGGAGKLGISGAARTSAVGGRAAGGGGGRPDGRSAGRTARLSDGVHANFRTRVFCSRSSPVCGPQSIRVVSNPEILGETLHGEVRAKTTEFPLFFISLPNKSEEARVENQTHE